MRTDTPNWIAEDSFYLEAPDKSGQDVIIRLGTPYEIDNHWACAVDVGGDKGRLVDIHGASSLQAVNLAARIIGEYYKGLQDKGYLFKRIDDKVEIAIKSFLVWPAD